MGAETHVGVCPSSGHSGEAGRVQEEHGTEGEEHGCGDEGDALAVRGVARHAEDVRPGRLGQILPGACRSAGNGEQLLQELGHPQVGGGDTCLVEETSGADVVAHLAAGP